MIEWKQNQLWYVDFNHSLFGININERMTIMRLEDNSLLIYNPAPLDASLQHQLSQLGNISCITTANKHHHHYFSDWWLHYPDASFLATPGLAQKRSDLGFDGVLNSTTCELWDGQLYQTLLRGNEEYEEVVFCDPKSKTLIFGENMILLNQGNWIKKGLGILLYCHSHAHMPFHLRRQVQEPQLLRQSLQEILTWPFEHILPIYGDPIIHGGKKELAQAFSWLLNNANSP